MTRLLKTMANMKLLSRAALVRWTLLGVAATGLTPATFACEMCKAAMAARDGRALSAGLNASILFMLVMVFTIPAGFGFVMWRSFRSEAERRARGEDVATPGAMRWTEPPRERD
jgi:type IV secretory pathway TrbD component